MQSEEPYQGLTCRESSWKRGVPSGTRTQVVHGCRQLVPWGVGLSPATSATLVFSCQHLVWNPEQTDSDKPEEGEDDVKSSCPLCPGRHTCYIVDALRHLNHWYHKKCLFNMKLNRKKTLNCRWTWNNYYKRPNAWFFSIFFFLDLDTTLVKPCSSLQKISKHTYKDWHSHLNLNNMILMTSLVIFRNCITLKVNTQQYIYHKVHLLVVPLWIAFHLCWLDNW